MPQALVITRPFYDPATSYLHRWSIKVVKFARSKINHVSDLDTKRANRKEFESVISKLAPDVIIINGHGTPDSVLGQNNEVLIKAGVNEQILKGANVYALTCDSGKVLGPASVKAGARGYIGYSQPFVFATMSEEYSTTAEHDPLAKLFLEPVSEIALSLIAGNTVQEAHKKGQNSFIKSFQSVLLSNSKEEYLARFLAWDIQSQVCFTL